MIILLNVKNDAYWRIFGAWACSRAEISFFEILKHQSGQTTLQYHFYQTFFQRSMLVPDIIIKNEPSSSSQTRLQIIPSTISVTNIENRWKFTRNYYAVVKKLQRFQSRCKYFTTASRFLQRNGHNSDIWWKVVIFALKMDVFCTKMIALKFHISSVNQKNDFNAFSASVVEQRLF